MSVFLMLSTSWTLRPLTHSVATELDAIAEPQPNVLNSGQDRGHEGLPRRLCVPDVGALTGVGNYSIRRHLDLQLHDVATGGCADEASAYVLRILVE